MYIQKLKDEKEFGFWGHLGLFTSSAYLELLLKYLQMYSWNRNAF